MSDRKALPLLWSQILTTSKAIKLFIVIQLNSSNIIVRNLFDIVDF